MEVVHKYFTHCLIMSRTKYILLAFFAIFALPSACPVRIGREQYTLGGVERVILCKYFVMSVIVNDGCGKVYCLSLRVVCRVCFVCMLF